MKNNKKISQIYSEKLLQKLDKLTVYLLIVVCLFLAISIVRSYLDIRSGFKMLEEKQSKIEKLALEKDKLKKDLEKVSSEQFIEKQIRDQLGYSKEGEVVLVLPDAEVLRKYAPSIEEEEDIIPDPNWKKWAKLFGFVK